MGNSVAQKFGYNGIELEESLGLNLMEMDVRLFDPAIARWNGIDPVTHHSQSTYNGFDNNPIYWSDPSGADATSLINDIWNKSGSGSTTWTNNNNGTFSGSNGATAEDTDYNNGGCCGSSGNGFRDALAFQDALHGRSSGINPNLANGGLMSAYNGAVRTWYALSSYNLKPYYNSLSSADWQTGLDRRYRYKLKARGLSSPVWRRLLNLTHPVEALTVPEGAVKSPTRFFRTNLSWNVAGGLSLTAGVFGLGVSGYNIYHAENRGQQAVVEASAWGGAWLGAEVVGGAVASVFPHPVAVGAGAIVGGIFGGVMGRDGMERAIENNGKMNFSGLDNSMKNCRGNVCFGLGTEVVVDFNEFKNIETIQKGDIILSYDNKENTFIKNKVLEVSKNMVSEYIVLSLKDGTEINVTYGHHILTRDNGYVISNNIKKGDYLANESGNGKMNFLEVISTKENYKKLEVFNLKTEQNNFLITKNGIIVIDSSGLLNLTKKSK